VNRSAPEPDPTDAELVQRAQGGDPAAFAGLVSRYQDRVFNTCYRMCHHQADALDLTQAVFLRALEALPRYRSSANFFTWMYRIALNLMLTDRRRHRRRRTLPLDASGRHTPAEPAAHEPDGSEVVRRQETAARVQWALDQLDDEFRAAVVLKDIENLNYATIAEILGVPVGTVKSRIHRGRLLLRDLLNEERTAVDAARTPPA